MSKRAFRILLFTSWVLPYLIGAAHILTSNYLPVELKDCYDIYIHNPQNTNLFVFLIFLAYLAFTTVIAVGLFFFKKWARDLFLPSIVLGIIIVAIFGRVVLDVAWVEAVKYLSSFINGIVWFAAYYSPVSDLFNPVQFPVE